MKPLARFTEDVDLVDPVTGADIGHHQNEEYYSNDADHVDSRSPRSVHGKDRGTQPETEL